jgi:VanZ family protein
MTTGKPNDPKVGPDSSGWSNRVVIAALGGIYFLTLYPFYFELNRHLPGNRFPMALGGWGKPSTPVDVLLNILLFVPLGFGVGSELRRRNRSVPSTFAWSLLAGALVSYSVEILQIYVPPRDSGWEDVINNSLGSGLGSLLFVFCGVPVVSLLSAAERAADRWLKPHWALVILALYFAVWTPAAISLQKETLLSGWNPQSRLTIGNRPNGSPGSSWRGKILELQLWDRAVPSNVAGDLVSNKSTDLDPVPIASYKFSSAPPIQDQRGYLPDLIVAPALRVASDQDSTVLDGDNWLMSREPVSALVDRLEQSRQFALRIVCDPALTDAPESIIFSIWPPAGSADLFLVQDGSSLFFWFRTPLLAKRRYLAVALPRLFTAGQIRDILLSYDGGKLSIYDDGNPLPRAYRLSAGVALARFVRRVKPMELEGYRYIFYALVFLPAGCLLGLAWRTLAAPRLRRFLLLLLIFLLPCFLLELCLMHISGRSLSKSDVALSILFLLAGCFWINADRGVFNPRPSEWIERTS